MAFICSTLEKLVNAQLFAKITITHISFKGYSNMYKICLLNLNPRPAEPPGVEREPGVTATRGGSAHQRGGAAGDVRLRRGWSRAERLLL